MSRIHFEYKAEGDGEPRVELILDEPSKEKRVARLTHIFVCLIELFGEEAAKEALTFLLTVGAEEDELRR